MQTGFELRWKQGLKRSGRWAALATLALLAAEPGLCLEQQPAAGGTAPKADRQAQKHLTMEEIVVSDERLDAATGTAVTARKIEQGRNLTLPDVLKNEPDIDVTRPTLVGDSGDNLSIRGFGGARVLLNINGRPVNSAGVCGGSYIDWSTVPLDNIEKIEIIKGGSSAKYGNNAIGGVINVVTRKPTDKPTLTFFSNYGFSEDIDGMQNYRLSHTYKVGPVGYALSGSYQKSEPYLWNNDFESRNFASNFYVDMPLGGQLMLGYQYVNADKGFVRNNRKSSDPYSPLYYEKINEDYPLASGCGFSGGSPGDASVAGPGANWDKTKYYLDLGYTQPIGEALLEFKLYKSKETRNEKNYASTVVKTTKKDGSPVVEGELVLDRKIVSDKSSGGSLELTLPWAKHELLIGAEHKNIGTGGTHVRYIDVAYDTKATASTSRSASTSEGLIWAYYIQDNWRISERWQVTPGLRYDDYRDHNINAGSGLELKSDGYSPKFTVTYSPTEHDAITTSVYQALRTPTRPESGWWAGETHEVPTLKPEKNNAAELVYMHRFSGADYARVSAYYYEVEDYIHRINFAKTASTPAWRTSYNIDEVKQQGISFDAHKMVTDWASLNASLTYQKADVAGDMFDPGRLTDGLSNFPEWKSSLGAEFQLLRKASFNVNLRYVGSREKTQSRTVGSGAGAIQELYVEKMSDYLTTDISLRIPVRQHVELGLYVENLFSEEYEESNRYPMPGAVMGATVKLAL